MAKLTSKARNALPDSAFALPDKRKYPIENPSHARNALAREHFASLKEQAAISRKVHNKFPSIKVEGESASKRADRAARR